jgi:molybdenum cofactor cytidylyltransferase
MLARTGCIVLAAGEARRFGGRARKLLAPLGEKPLLQHAIDAACSSAALRCTLVLGAEWESIINAVDARRCAVIVNHEWREGIASSIRAGLSWHADDDACIFLVGDQPFITSADIDALLSAGARDPVAIIATRARAVWGSPVLFPRLDFPALKSLSGDRGAKRYAAAQKQRLSFVPARDPRLFADVDSPGDYARVARRQRGR